MLTQSISTSAPIGRKVAGSYRATAGVHLLRKPLLDESLISHIRGALDKRSTCH
jgi:hypothetical protein